MAHSVLIAHFVLFAISAEANCQSWFKELKLQKDEKCLLACMTGTVDMSSFDCHEECPALCSIPKKEQILFALSDLYPGLTKAEKALATTDPTKAMKAYKLSWEAEEHCLTIFKTSQMDDESDACRHFFWAALMRNDLGLDFASKVLDAHETNPDELQAQRAMDLANNRLGIIVAEKLLKDKNWGIDQLKKTFRESLDTKKLIVNKSLRRNFK